jgi:nucleoside-diphosphate-sugar epimerase|nr:SDR family oxidoreductase [Kofleriaceae bacterium]
MRIFITGAAGWVGSAVVRELVAARHQVTGLARSDANAAKLTAAGAAVHRGNLDDLDSLRAGAAAAEAVVHCGFNHDFANYAAAAQTDLHAIEALAGALVGTNRTLLVTSGTALLAPGRLAVESDAAVAGPMPRRSEQAALPFASQGVRVGIVRLPPTVHGAGDHGFVPILVTTARDKRAAAYVGDGANRWPAVHVSDAGRLYKQAIERPFAPGTAFHAVAEDGIAMRDIAGVIGRKLGVPVTSVAAGDAAAAHFGWFAHFAGLDAPASSARTRDQLAWQPTGPQLIADLEANYV